MLLLLITLTGCMLVTKMKMIDQVIYGYNSGPILPEMQLYEQYTIFRDRVEFSRINFSNDSMVNSGIWLVQVEEQKILEFLILLIMLFVIVSSAMNRCIHRMEVTH